MKIDYVEIKNFCQHRERTETLGAGVVGILGRNGEGKSNFVHAIKRGLTGDSGNAGNKDADITWGETDGYVKVGFTVGTTEGSIKRALGNARCSMKFGDQTYKTATEIERVLYDILGVPPAMLHQMVFVSQGVIEGVLFQKPSERKAAFQTLFGTEQAERLRVVIAAEADTVIISDRTDVIARTQQQLDEVLPQIAATLAELEKHKMVTPDILAIAHDTVRCYGENTRTTAQLDECRRQSDGFQATITANKPQLAAAEAYEAELIAMRNEMEPQVQAAQQQLNDYGKVEMQVRQRYNLESRIASAKILQNTPGPTAIPEAGTLPQLHADKERLSGEYAALKNSLQAATGKICPTCKQTIQAGATPGEVSNIQTVLDCTRRSLEEVTIKIAQLDMRVQGYSRDFAVWTASQKQAAETEAQAHRELALIPAGGQLMGADQTATLQALVQMFNLEVVAGLERARRNTIALASALGQVEAQKAAVDKRIVELSATLTTPVSPTEYQFAQSIIEANQQATIAIAAAQGKLRVLETQEASLTEQIAQYKREEAHMEGMKRWKEQLERARALFHRDQLPNLVAQEFIKVLNARLAFYLETFEVKFLAQIQEDLSVLCTFSGNHQMMAERLSGGQKVMLGIAFRFAVYDMFVSNLGMLILDEPTVFLDDGNIDHVYNLLLRVRSYSKSAGLQLIVVTHEKRLVNIFDKVIEI